MHVMRAVTGKIQPDHTVADIQRAGAQVDGLVAKAQSPETLEDIINAVLGYELTFADYDRFCAATGRKKPDDRGWGRGRHPVINVSWEDATAYARWLSEQTGHDYRLPTEAEWEYAARAGGSGDYWWGDQAPVCRKGARNGAKFDDDASCDDTGTEPVGGYSANPFGLYDTAGNVWEWVEDWYKDYPSGTVIDPVVRQGGPYRVSRGGTCIVGPRKLRSAYRSYAFRPGKHSAFLGFRLARTL